MKTFPADNIINHNLGCAALQHKPWHQQKVLDKQKLLWQVPFYFLLCGVDLVWVRSRISISNWEYPASTAFNIHQCSYIINYRFSWLVAASDCWLYPSSLVGARMVPPFTPFKTVLGRPWQPSGRSWSNSYKRRDAMQLVVNLVPSFFSTCSGRGIFHCMGQLDVSVVNRKASTIKTFNIVLTHTASQKLDTCLC